MSCSEGSGGASRMVEDLAQVVLNMADIVERDVGEGHNRVVANLARGVAEGFRDTGDDVREVTVVGTPKLDQVGPAPLAVVLRCNPVLLSVSREVERRHGLGTHETLVVVGCGVDRKSVV